MSLVPAHSDLTLEPGMLRMPSGLGENAQGTVLPIAPLIQRIVACLDEARVPWAVLRNAEGLPDYTRYDLDILTMPRDLEAFIQIVQTCAGETGWRIAGRIQKRHYTCLMLMYGAVDNNLFFLPLDLFTALEFRGLRYLNAADVLRDRVRTPKGIWTVPAGTDAAITLLKELFPHGFLKENSRISVQTQATADPERFRAALEFAAGPGMAARLVESVCRGEWSLAPADTKALHRYARKHAPAWPWSFFQAGWSNLTHLFRPSLGLVVCLAGADGSGKTTLAQGLTERMFKRPFKACRYIHGNVGVLPQFRDIRAFLSRLVGKGHPAPTPEPQKLKGMMAPIPAWKSMLLATYYAMDLLLARLLLRRWRGQWMLVLMDRSFYDYYYQLGHRQCPQWYLDLLSILIPKPDLLFYITGDAEQIHARKPELTVEEIRIEQEILHKLAERLPFAHRLDGDAGIEAMVEAGQREILELLTAKAKV